MDFEGRVIQYLGETTGTSRAGNPWKKKEWIVETFGQFPRKVKLQCFGDRSDSLNIEQGRDYTFSVDLESREYNGRWYTDVSVFRISETQGNGGFNNNQSYQQGPQMGTPAQNFNQPYGTPTDNYGNQPFTPSVEEGDEDLPF